MCKSVEKHFLLLDFLSSLSTEHTMVGKNLSEVWLRLVLPSETKEKGNRKMKAKKLSRTARLLLGSSAVSLAYLYQCICVKDQTESSTL